MSKNKIGAIVLAGGMVLLLISLAIIFNNSELNWARGMMLVSIVISTVGLSTILFKSKSK